MHLYLIEMRRLFFMTVVAALSATTAFAQKYNVNENTHSHNDYLQTQPFYTAHGNGFGSMEADVYMVGNELFVAHERKEIDSKRTLERLYLKPIIDQIALNGNNKIYKDGGHMQLLIDLKTDAEPTLRLLEQKLKPYRKYFDVKSDPNAVKLVITGNQPAANRFKSFDDMFYFDGKRGQKYTPEELGRVALFSAGFQQFSAWNGLGRMVHNEYDKTKAFVDSVHSIGKKVRFWGNPDTKTCWQAFIKIGVDYINTDQPADLARFLNKYEDNSYLATGKYQPYKPTYATDNNKKKPKNVILLISDGAGFSEFWAAATANGGQMNATNIKHIGFSNTAPADDYNTDSAAGATAMATGEKTNNRYIGMDSKGKKIANLPEVLSKYGYRSAIVSNDGIAGATPSSFFAHRTERNDADSITLDIRNSPAVLFIGASRKFTNPDSSEILKKVKASGFDFYNGVSNLPRYTAGKKVICFDNDKPETNYHMIEEAFDRTVSYMSADNKSGFFLVIEGAKIDGGGHANRIKQCIDEYLSFDRVIGKALQFADKDGETLVLITSDHETGGLIIYDGDYKKGSVNGTFTTNDHTGLPVLLLGYGPCSENFTGFLDNSNIPKKITNLLKK
jgi:alkaline phosphatase